MKRIKIMLAALTVLAIAGGALAFKAQKFGSFCYYSSTAAHDGTGFPPNYCNFNVTDGFKLGDAGGNYFATSAEKVLHQCPTTITCTQKWLSETE
jgi:hypothetical protein